MKRKCYSSRTPRSRQDWRSRMFASRRFRCLEFGGLLFSLSLLPCNASANAAAQAGVAAPAPNETSPSSEAFRVLPQPDGEAPQITPYLLYQTSLAWHQDELRQARWSQVKTENDLLQLRASLRKSVLDMIGGLPTEKTDLHATITGRISASGFHIEKL